MNIDPKTNLPELPEGQYWSVQKNYSTYEMLLMEVNNEFTAPITSRPHPNPFLALFGVKVTGPEEFEKQPDRRIDSEDIFLSEPFTINLRLPDSASVQAKNAAEALGEDWVYRYKNLYDEEEGYELRNYRLSETAVLNAATRIWNRQDQQRKRKEEEAKFLGDYPPKTL